MGNKSKTYDFSGYATKNDVVCSDGRIIRKGAFSHNNGKKVPLVWNHNHDAVDRVLGHSILKEDNKGIYAYCYLNDTKAADIAKVCINHGDFNALSIYANHVKEKGSNVIHGDIKEVSLCLAGANPEALIDTVITHSDDDEESVIIALGTPISLAHSDDDNTDTTKDNDEIPDVQAVLDTLTEEQLEVVYGLIGMALEEDTEDSVDNQNDNEGGPEMHHNVFDNDINNNEEVTLSHSEMNTIFSDAKRLGSLKESYLAHAEEYGIKDIDMLFPDAKPVATPPGFVNNDDSWVSDVMNNVHRYPFSRIKSLFADIREDEARAKGYTKGKYKKEEVFSLLKRETTPTTVYKKQRLDKDDISDITDFDVVAWVKGEMRTKLDEELARCFLVGDGRSVLSADKVSETNIRPIWTDEDLYSIKKRVESDGSATDSAKANDLIDAVIRARSEYRGSGTPMFFVAQKTLTDMLLIKDTTGRRIYNSVTDLATALMVSKIVPVEVMDNCKRTDNGDTVALLGIMVNLKDYYVGADKGGDVSLFDDFDIDYNQMKYLIETRCSGALTVPYGAIVFEKKVS